MNAHAVRGIDLEFEQGEFAAIVGPFIDFSLLEDLDLSLYFQFFRINQTIVTSELKTRTIFAFLRIKWSF